MDWTDLSERVLFADTVFDVGFCDDPEIVVSFQKYVDWLELRLIGWGPNSEAVRFLKNIANSQDNAQLAQGLHGEWRREQIEAVLREILGDVLRP
ncbi:MAG TPA: hypothetical protein VKW06_10635 [Candidatus Angelobacter sp.]|nr:hypothetical protein [Candidatus Angelobacter sp.]